MASGRQRQFDTEQALTAVMMVFWKNGYSSTSLTDLTAATGINKPSLYAAFGNKEALFILALKHYGESQLIPRVKALRFPGKTLKQRVELYLKSMVKMGCDTSLPGGCLIVNSRCESTGEHLPQKVKETLKETLKSHRNFHIQFFTEEQTQGNLSSELNAKTVALYFHSLLQGIAAMSRNGLTLQELNKVIEMAVRQL